MTGKEALFASLTMTPKQALQASQHSESATLRLVCKWKIEEPVAYHDVIRAAGIKAVVEAEMSSHPVRRGTVRTRIADYFSNWHDYVEACDDLDMSYNNVKQALTTLRKQGWQVERRQKHPGQHGGLQWRVIPPQEAA